MQFRPIALFLLSGLFWLASWIVTPVADALTPVKLYDIYYETCPEDIAQGNVSSGDMKPAKCFIVKGKAENTSGKNVVDADVFGRIYDANGNNVMANRGRVGTILEVPPGVSDFEIRISVPANQSTPLTLKQFKASGFAQKVRPFYYDD
ncbi:MAG: hypothetical protein QNJ41_16825 [Xenococcaceae cyanobacterium MO_188.B32]|nr:hypothetical protein [Xenococcaceae cyanobacterium MO_188.B32]